MSAFRMHVANLLHGMLMHYNRKTFLQLSLFFTSEFNILRGSNTLCSLL
jgi:hypothetical protein